MDVMIGIRTIVCCVLLCNGLVTSARIRQFPKNATVLQGSDVTFHCGVEKQQSDEYIFWKRVGHSGFMDLLAYNNVITNASKYAVHEAFALTVRHVTVADEGRYECQAGTDRARAFLHVVVMMANMTMSWSLVPPLTPSPLVKLACHVLNSRPAAIIRWYHDDEEITETASTNRDTDALGFGDVYSTIRVRMSGLVSELPYTCEASLPSVNVSRSELIFPNVEALASSCSSLFQVEHFPSMLAVAVALHVVFIV